MNILFAKIRRWWSVLRRQQPHYETLYVVSNPPEPMQPRLVYVVTEDGQPWRVSLACPCGCGADLHLNLLPDERPCWHVTHHWTGLISLHPSIWRTKGCGAHFWITHGRIRWCDRYSPLVEQIAPLEVWR